MAKAEAAAANGVATFYISSDYNSQLRRFRVRFSNRDIQFHIRPHRRKEGRNEGGRETEREKEPLIKRAGDERKGLNNAAKSE